VNLLLWAGNIFQEKDRKIERKGKVVKFSHELEKIFFESIIIDINLSKWDEFISLVVISEWDELDGVIFPSSNVVMVNFSEAELNLSMKQTHPKIHSCFPGIQVNNINIIDKKNLIINSPDFIRFEINFKKYDLIYVDRGLVNFIKKIQKNGYGMICSDINSLFSKFGTKQA